VKEFLMSKNNSSEEENRGEENRGEENLCEEVADSGELYRDSLGQEATRRLQQYVVQSSRMGKLRREYAASVRAVEDTYARKYRTARREGDVDDVNRKQLARELCELKKNRDCAKRLLRNIEIDRRELARAILLADIPHPDDEAEFLAYSDFARTVAADDALVASIFSEKLSHTQPPSPSFF
jgi:hypothetical protein